MEAWKGTLVGLVASTLALTHPLPAAAQDATASGTLTLNGAAAALRFVYVFTQPGFRDPAVDDLRVILSDIELPEDVRSETFALARLARQGRLHGIEVIVDAHGEPLSGFVFAEPFHGLVSVSGVHRFDPSRLERTRIAGRLWMDGPRTFSGVTYHYDATFAAPIPRAPTPEEVAVALASPPARVAESYLAAIRGGELRALVATLVASAAAEYEGPDGASRFEALRAEIRPDSRVVGLTMPAPSSAVATVQGTRDGVIVEFAIELAFEEDGWRVVR